MGDLMNQCDVLKKLGFESANQWILYDERFQKFFNFFTDNISDVNILTEREALERDTLMQRQQYLEPTECKEQLQLVEIECPGLLHYTQVEVTSLTHEVDALERAEEEYISLVEDMRYTKHKINSQLSDLEGETSLLLNQEKELLSACQSKSRQLEELQRDNQKLCNEATRCFTKNQSPPLFMHQLPLDQYLHKCDAFMQYFTLYMKENFKIQDYVDLDGSASDISVFSDKLQVLAKSFEYYTMEYIKEKAKAKATQSLIELLDLTQIHVISLTDMERETRELELINEHHLKIAYETLLNDLVIHVQQRTQQRMELILYENTKQKLERAVKRHESDKHLTKIISDALSNAEIVWIAIQLDLERKRNRFVNTEQLSKETDACWRRIKYMRTFQSTLVEGGSAALLESVAELLSQALGQKVRSEAKPCLYEYEKFCRLLAYALQGILSKKHYTQTNEQLKELARMEEILRPMVYNSPVAVPMFEHVRFLIPIYNARLNQNRIDNTLRDLRTQFQENITERMERDKLWRYSQLLWIWFLTEPRRVLMVIEEVKKIAAKIPTLTGMKSLSGIKRR